MKLLVCYNKFLITFIICNSDNLIWAYFLEINKQERLLVCPMLYVFDLENCQCQTG